MELFENIRRIGMFMIAAQTVIHFAAGKQYEKYMKVISGVIILMMFIGPFVSGSESLAINWREEADRLEKQIQESMKQEMTYDANLLETVALLQIEEEVKFRLNDMIPDDGAEVTDVSIELERTFDAGTGSEGHNWVFQRVKVTLRGDDEDDPTDTYDGGIILIDEIAVGYGSDEDMEQEEPDLDRDTKMRKYQHVFAQTLGIADDRVEVIYRGGS